MKRRLHVLIILASLFSCRITAQDTIGIYTGTVFPNLRLDSTANLFGFDTLGLFFENKGDSLFLSDDIIITKATLDSNNQVIAKVIDTINRLTPPNGIFYHGKVLNFFPSNGFKPGTNTIAVWASIQGAVTCDTAFAEVFLNTTPDTIATTKIQATNLGIPGIADLGQRDTIEVVISNSTFHPISRFVYFNLGVDTGNGIDTNNLVVDSVFLTLAPNDTFAFKRPLTYNHISVGGPFSEGPNIIFVWPSVEGGVTLDSASATIDLFLRKADSISTSSQQHPNLALPDSAVVGQSDTLKLTVKNTTDALLSELVMFERAIDTGSGIANINVDSVFLTLSPGDSFVYEKLISYDIDSGAIDRFSHGTNVLVIWSSVIGGSKSDTTSASIFLSAPPPSIDTIGVFAIQINNLGLRDSVLTGQSDSLRLVIENKGSTVISKMIGIDVQIDTGNGFQFSSLLSDSVQVALNPGDTFVYRRAVTYNTPGSGGTFALGSNVVVIWPAVQGGVTLDSAQATTFIESISSIDRGSLNPNLSLWPNPVKDLLQLKGESPNKIRTIFIYDLQGKKVHTVPPSNQLEIGFLNKGTYIIELIGIDGGQHIQKVVKE